MKNISNEELKNLYESGLNTYQIADKFNCNQMTIWRKLKKYGVKLRDNHSHKNINLGSKNGMWKGDKVGYGGVHDWVKKRKPKIAICERCRIKKSFDLANISGQYKRNVSDYWWICRTCHMEIDGRMNLLHQPGKHKCKMLILPKDQKAHKALCKVKKEITDVEQIGNPQIS